MTKKRIIAALYRAREMLMWCIGMSVLICTLCVTGPMPVGSIQRDITLIVAPIIFIICNIIMLRMCYYAMRGKKSYYIVNLCAYAIFAVISLSIYKFCPVDTYTWLFVITRFARYSSLGISSPMAIFLFHIILIASIFLAPIGMGWVKKKAEEKRQYIKNMPPKLKINTADNAEKVHNEQKEKKEENSLS